MLKKRHDNFSTRFDFMLILEIFSRSVAFALSIFGIANVVVFILTEEWPFGPSAARGIIIVFVVFTVIYTFKGLYDFIKDKCEERQIENKE